MSGMLQVLTFFVALLLGRHPQEIQQTESSLVYVVALLGQSHAAGWDSPMSDDLAPSFPTTIQNAWVFDKYKRDNQLALSLLDNNRGNEMSIIRPLTLGYGGTGANYPWEGLEPDPQVGPEMSMANVFTTQRGAKLVVCKAAFGGTAVMDIPSADDWSPTQLAGGTSYVDVFIQTYWNPTIEQAVQLAGGDRSRVRVLGIVWLQGFADARYLSQALAYAENAHNTLTAISTNMQTSVPVPIKVFRSPLAETAPGVPVAEIETVRAQQLLLASNSGSPFALPFCSVIEVPQLPGNPNSFPHFSTLGYDLLGQMMGNELCGECGRRLLP